MNGMTRISLTLALALAPLALSADEPNLPPNMPKHLADKIKADMAKHPEGDAAARPARQMSPGRAGVRRGEGVELNDEQLKKLEAGSKERQDKQAAALKAVEEARKAHQDLMAEERNDSSHLDRLRRSFADLQEAEQAVAKLDFEEQLAVRGVMNGEQVKKQSGRMKRRGDAPPKPERKGPPRPQGVPGPAGDR